MIISMIIYIFVLILFSILIFWKTILNMVKKKKIFEFLPFFIIAIFICFDAAFAFYDLFYNFVWIFMQALYLIIFIWILIFIRGKNGFN